MPRSTASRPPACSSGSTRRPGVLVVTTFENDYYVYDAPRPGLGVPPRALPSEDFVAAIRTVQGGESLLFPQAIRALVEPIALGEG